MRKIRAIDLCCGAGGWAAAARGLPIEFVAVVDWKHDCLETWRVNHADQHPDCQAMELDLSEWNAVDRVASVASGVDLILGGIPCEQVSVARQGKASAETMDAWHQLIDVCIGMVDAIGPTWWCYEDVIQIEKHLPLPLFRGREIPRQRVQASDYGPQNRLRTFLGEFPAPTPPSWGCSQFGKPTLRHCLRPGPHLIVDRADSYEAHEALNGRLTMRGDIVRICRPDKVCPTIITGLATRGGRQRRCFTIIDARGRRRQLSWQEAAKVQGFPDDYLFVGGITRAMEMVGRAIPIYVGRAILEAIVRANVQVEVAR